MTVIAEHAKIAREMDTEVLKDTRAVFVHHDLREYEEQGLKPDLMITQIAINAINAMDNELNKRGAI